MKISYLLIYQVITCPYCWICNFISDYFPSLEENAEAEDDRIAEETEELFKDRIETAEEIFKRKYGGNKLFVFLGKYNLDLYPFLHTMPVKTYHIIGNA